MVKNANPCQETCLTLGFYRWSLGLLAVSREDQFLYSGTLRWGWKSVLTDLEHQGISLEWVLVLFITLDQESWCPALLGHPVRSRGEKSRWAAVTP